MFAAKCKALKKQETTLFAPNSKAKTGAQHDSCACGNFAPRLISEGP
jgi:hypothetical protein